jgi:sigma-B regulation protein RsbU (phosphoserine phosphatase)
LILNSLPWNKPGSIVRRIGTARAFTQSEAEVVGKPLPLLPNLPKRRPASCKFDGAEGRETGVSMKLLIAEDDAYFRTLLEHALAPDYELVVAQDGNEAWAALQEPDAPRLAILDWVMPGLSGPEICRKVRACAQLSSMYLIIFTAKNSMADIVSGLRAGADDYITKPPVTEELKARVALGIRILKLQVAAATQSALAHQAVEREHHLRETIADCPLCRKPRGQQSSQGVESYLLDAVSSRVEPDSLVYRLPIRSMENSHS